MIPFRIPASVHYKKMPRTCGDDPGDYRIADYFPENAPHLRGWFFSWTYVCYGKWGYDAYRLFLGLTMTYDELYVISRSFFEAHATPEQIAFLDSHEKCDGAGFVDSILFFIDMFLGDRPGVPEKIANWKAVLDSLPEYD